MIAVIVYFQFYVKLISTLLLIISNVMQNDILSVALLSVIVFEMISMSLFRTNPMINAFVQLCFSYAR